MNGGGGSLLLRRRAPARAWARRGRAGGRSASSTCRVQPCAVHARRPPRPRSSGTYGWPTGNCNMHQQLMGWRLGAGLPRAVIIRYNSLGVLYFTIKVPTYRRIRIRRSSPRAGFQMSVMTDICFFFLKKKISGGLYGTEIVP